MDFKERRRPAAEASYKSETGDTYFEFTDDPSDKNIEEEFIQSAGIETITVQFELNA